MVLCRSINFLNILLLFAIVMINFEHYGVLGEGYQASDQSLKGSGYSNNGDDSSSPANYMFEYGIDDHYGPTLSHQEERNGYQTRGRYTVLLPDGRLQIVSYRADKNGYNADITYEPSTSTSFGQSQNSYGGEQRNSGGSRGGYENFGGQPSASSYGPPPSLPSPKNNYDGGKGANQIAAGNRRQGSQGGKGNARSFVRFRRTDNGRTFNYEY